jgi:hypothetical protein
VTAQGKRRTPRDGPDLTFSEVCGLMRRSYQRPIPEVEPLHVMARRRIVAAATDSPADDNTSATEIAE